jgi:sporulation protein YabP
MEDMGNVGTRMHKVMLGNRRTCTISGVNDVLSFDIREILLETEQGMLMIKGDDLHVNRLTLDKGEVDVDGKIDSLTYSDIGSSKMGAKGESFFTKLFR